MERRSLLKRLGGLVSGLVGGTLVLKSSQSDAQALNIDASKLPDWASPTGKSYAGMDICGGECGTMCGNMCSSQCLSMCARMCGVECGTQCAAQCDFMCGAGGGVQFCFAQAGGGGCVAGVQCDDQHGCVFMNCKSGTAATAAPVITAIKAFEFRFNLATLKPEYMKYRPLLIEEFYDKFTKGSKRRATFPELEEVRKRGGR